MCIIVVCVCVYPITQAFPGNRRHDEHCHEFPCERDGEIAPCWQLGGEHGLGQRVLQRLRSVRHRGHDAHTHSPLTDEQGTQPALQLAHIFNTLLIGKHTHTQSTQYIQLLNMSPHFAFFPPLDVRVFLLHIPALHRHVLVLG